MLSKDWIQFTNSQFSDKRQAARGVGLLEVFPWSFCVDEQFRTVLALKFFSFLVLFLGGTGLRFP